MTSRNSFWASSRENHKRRVWVWIVAALSQVIAYVGILSVYLSRINLWNERGSYRTVDVYKEELRQAARDALAFSENLGVVVAGLAVIIGLQGFSYLYDRKKVDMYHSVPVDKKRRFFVIYVNGIFIYLITALLGVLAGVVVAAAQGAVDGVVLANIGLGFVWNLLFFLVVYHMIILAVMLTGNRLITLCVFGVLFLFNAVFYVILVDLQSSFFDTWDTYFCNVRAKLSVFTDYSGNVWRVGHMKTVAETLRAAAPFYGKWLLIAFVLFVLAFVCYLKRKSEAAGWAIAYKPVEPVLKIVVSMFGAALIGIMVYSSSADNKGLMVAGMLGGALIICAVMEVIYDFDIKSACRHLLSTGVAVIGIFAVFCIFNWDLFGYDNYIPEESEVESIAFSASGYYYNYWDEEFAYISSADFEKDNMFITNVNPALTLVRNALQEDYENMSDPRRVSLLYRLRSGREVGRAVWVDYGNPVTEELMNQIIGTDEYHVGTWQIITDEDSYNYVKNFCYWNGAAKIALPIEEVKKLREAYIKDLEQVDFSLLRHSYPCGKIEFLFAKYKDADENWAAYGGLPVYECFENTIAWLKAEEAYYPVELNAGDIDSITVVNYHNELMGQRVYMDGNMWRETAVVEDAAYPDDVAVSETFYEEEEIAEILKAIYPNDFVSDNWHSTEEIYTQNNYDVKVTFKKDSDYPYTRGDYFFSYSFVAGQVPEFVEEATAYVPE